VAKEWSIMVAMVRPGTRAFHFPGNRASRWTWVMKRLTQVSALVALIVSLAACAEFSVYKPAPDVPLADVRLSPEMAKEALVMCQAPHDCHELPPFNDVIQVPTNQRISLYREYQGRPYGREGFCSAGISFLPKYGQRYFAAFMIVANQCTLRIYRWSPKHGRPQQFEFGQATADLAAYVTFDPTMGPPIPLYKN
jgi:hypothetical protein